MSTVIGRVHVAQVTGIPAGRLLVYAPRWNTGTATIHLLDNRDEEVQAFYAELKAHKDADGRECKVATFPLLPPGNYRVAKPGFTYSGRNVTVFPGELVEVDFTQG